ncbi:tRNA threonylcarbamoyladenosine dehydratase [Labilibaculum sp. DW002]|uniref:tRNA threonylcarbamoyladenosine dehydratase n=1 Tax=Paralabilibaculum antarcticum TaxID=2912572 RepID=A0ABT5VPB0_9BACT|nr:MULTISPECIES: tRNA threonylcarbamoyladenosine dehydratase [unclassified Labilibaculum]MBI9059690.1 tRNA threonylcarbamoyladenosine dehydratase [Labilibaculum sp.]MDE5417277.1 tRNA threonylcarbamoyladenosine dehydratase [Labilibaculum sp. DW002]
MSTEWLSRTELLLGNDKLNKLKSAHVLVVGLGGVGAYAAEQICRAGVGEMTIVDGDDIESTNINRQLPASISNLGKDKALVMGERLLDINPNLKLNIINEYLREERMIEVLRERSYDYVVDAIDTLAPKLFLIYHSLQNKLNIVSAMGAGGKMDPTKIQVTDISKSYNCRLARMLRKKLHQLGVRKGVQVVFSPEDVSKDAVVIAESKNKKSNVGTISYMPPLFGCFCSSVVINGLLASSEQNLN